MKRVFIMCYDPMGVVNIGILFKFFDSSSELLNWRAPALPGTVILVSRMQLHELANLLRVHMGGNQFLLAEIGSQSIDGWADPVTWGFIRDAPELPPTLEGLFPGLLPPGRRGLLPTGKK